MDRLSPEERMSYIADRHLVYGETQYAGTQHHERYDGEDGLEYPGMTHEDRESFASSNLDLPHDPLNDDPIVGYRHYPVSLVDGDFEGGWEGMADDDEIILDPLLYDNDEYSL